MLIRRLKPMHGWRVFIGEVGVIVLGVLIALGASQLVDAWQWRGQVKDAKLTFKHELEDAFGNAYLRLAVAPCLQSRVQEITKRLDEPGTRWRAMPAKLDFGQGPKNFPQLYDPPYTLVTVVAEGWSNALANGTLNHLPNKTEVSLARTYNDARRLGDEEKQEAQSAARLKLLGTDRELNTESRVALLQGLGELDQINDAINQDSHEVVSDVLTAPVGLNRHEMRAQWNDAVTFERKIRGGCVTEPELPYVGPDGRILPGRWSTN